MKKISSELRVAFVVAVVAAAVACSSSGVENSDSDGGSASDGGIGASCDGGTCGVDACDSGAASGSIITACGTIDSAAYRSMASQLGSAAGISYRYGDACKLDPKSFPTWSHPTDKNAVNTGGNPGWVWQVGGPQSSPTDQNLNDYSSNTGQALYVADDAGNPGVADLNPILMGGNTFSESPQLYWGYYGKGDPDVNLVDYQKSLTAPLTTPIAIGRCYGNFGWCENALVAFPNGFLGSTGTSTARNEMTFQLPTGKVPTSIAITNNNEFALISLWDTANVKGQVAVFALAGTCADCEPGPNQKAIYNWWGEWSELYPGLRNFGNLGFIKLLGYVDLPGMMAPTEISASADYIPSLDNQQGWMCAADGSSCRTGAYDLPLSVEANRQSFIGTGANANRYSKSGFAVVISKSEQKAIFLDLKPLFSKVQSMYFGSAADFATTKNLGQDDAQWPFSFAHSPDFAPVIVKTISLSQAPTSVKTSLQSVDRAWIGTIDGTLHVFDVGGYGDDDAGTPSEISEVGTVAVGKNPTWIAYAKHDYAPSPSNVAPVNREVIVVSREDCRIDWVSFNDDSKSGSVLRSLQDSRLIDPISAEDNDNHGTESYVLSVADYSGRQIANYRYGPVIFHTNPGAAGNSVAAACQPPNGCAVGMNGTDAFEFGGAYATAGKAFRFTSANTP